MGEHLTRVYRKGILEAEDFPVADVSDYLGGTGHGRLGRPLRPVEGPAARARRRARAARAGRRGRARSRTSAPSSTTTRRISSCPATPCASTPTAAVSTRRRSTPSSARAGSSPSARTTASPMEPVLERWDRSPDLASHGVSFLLYGLLDVDRRRLLRHRPGVRRLLRRGQRGDLRRTPARSGGAAPLVRDAPGARAVPPPGRADAGGGQRPDAARAHRRRRGRSTPTSRTSTTTSCASANRPMRCATS